MIKLITWPISIIVASLVVQLDIACYNSGNIQLLFVNRAIKNDETLRVIDHLATMSVYTFLAVLITTGGGLLIRFLTGIQSWEHLTEKMK